MDSPQHHHLERHLRHRAGGALVVALVGLALLVAACSSGPSSPGVASAGNDPSGHTSTASDIKPSVLNYSKCMQTHGIADFPDPNGKGQLSISASPGSDLDPSDPQFQAASNECAKYQPQPTAAQKADNLKHELAMATCMRAHGIKDFPDPNSQGMIQISGGPNSDLNPGNPQFQAAQSACSKDMGKGKGLPPLPAKGSGNATSGSGGSGFSTQIAG